MGKLVAILLLSVAMTPSASTAKRGAAKFHIETTHRETLWSGRFARCDFGFYVMLPRGVVAHANLPPNPIHGFLVALPEVGTRKEGTTDRERFIWTNAEYDATDSASAEEAVSYYIGQVGADKPNRKATRQQSRVGTIPATRIHVEYDGPTGRIVEEKVVALRRDIVYEIGLRTTALSYEADKQQFEHIVAAFHVWRVHYC